MALNAYLTLTATTQGKLLGSVSQKGREGTIMVTAVSHEIVAPRDPASGRPTGKRMHKPFVITKDLDRATPGLRSILTTNENIASWELVFYRPDGLGIEKPVFTVQLTNANIAGIHFHVLNVKRPALMKLPEHEEVSFTYQKILWTWHDGGSSAAISASDDWLTPR